MLNRKMLKLAKNTFKRNSTKPTSTKNLIISLCKFFDISRSDIVEIVSKHRRKSVFKNNTFISSKVEIIVCSSSNIYSYYYSSALPKR